MDFYIEVHGWSFTLNGFCGMSAYRLYAPRGEQIRRDLLGWQDYSCPHQAASLLFSSLISVTI